MIYCTIGVPSRFSEWCEALLQEVVAACRNPPTPFVADSLEQIGHELLVRQGADSIVALRQPLKAALKSLAVAGHPFLLTLDDPDSTVAALMTDYAVPFADAVRKTASCLAALLPAIEAKNALVLKASDTRSELVTARAIAQHFALDIDDEALAAAAARCPFRPAAVIPEAALGHELSPVPAIFEPLRRTGPTAAAALEALWNHIIGKPLREIVWNPDLFWLGDATAKMATEPVDVTGSSRCLIFGPYIRLPEGPWSCALMLGFSEHAEGLRMVADVVAGAPLNHVNFEIDEPGVFEIEFSFVNSNPDHPVEVRLFVADAAFEGEIMLGPVRLSPLKARRLTVS
jgi:hypothetical protein